MSLVKVQDINYYFQDGDQQRYILKDVNCEFEKGKFYTILGASGSGKTTFLSLLSALDKPKSGTILYNEKEIQEIGYEKFRRNHIGIVFQQYNLIPYMTALENVLVAMSITENTLPDKHKVIALNLLEYMGIDYDKANRVVTKLSGGEQQRVAIARALSTDVELILADEPTGNVNEDMADELVNVFQKLAHEYGKCVVVVTHSTQIAEQSDVTYRLSRGVMTKQDS